jgi:uncharacterized protein YqhQ
VILCEGFPERKSSVAKPCRYSAAGFSRGDIEMTKKKTIDHYSGIGGQAVLEGVMMKNQDTYAVAVRKPDGKIEVKTEEYKPRTAKWTKLPFIRGVFGFWDSLVLGMKCMTYSASFYEEEEEEDTALDKLGDKLFGEKAENVLMGITVVLSLVIAVALFMLLPYFLAGFLTKVVANETLLALFEGLIRLIIFLLYVSLISLMKDIRRVYQYHGAEHKCINCIEKGRILNVENVKKSSRQHKRCGTSFLLFVMLVSIILFFFIRVEQPVLRVALRILLIPVIAGISFEIIRLAGRSNNIIVRIISAPGLWLQKLTTKEPDEDMIEVAIASVEAVFDWKAYFKTEFGYDVDDAMEVEAESEKITEELAAENADGAMQDAVADDVEPDTENGKAE